MEPQKKTNKFVVGAFVLLGLLSSLSRADSLTLRDGRHLQGKFAGGTQGVIAFSVAGATQYYDVNNILVMTFEAEGDAQTAPNQQPSIIPEPNSIQRQKLQGKTANPTSKLTVGNRTEKKRPVRLIMAVQHSE